MTHMPKIGMEKPPTAHFRAIVGLSLDVSHRDDAKERS